MARTDRQMLQLAVAIHTKLACGPNTLARVELPNWAWTDAGDGLRLLKLAADRQWRHAANHQRQSVIDSLDYLRRELSTLLGSLQQADEPQFKLSAGDLYRELQALDEEFGSVDWDPDGKTLSVRTEPIVLGEISLGEFAIRLEISLFPSPGCYSVEALDPNPASSDEDVTHPHVREKTLCEGAGKPAVEAALASGRLHDFFLLVRSILRTYNPNGPYVALEDWEGKRCSDCGHIANEDDRSSCDRCGKDVCGECSNYCPSCSNYYCGDCVTPCSSCDERNCDGCLTECAECSEVFCRGCLNDNERCATCNEREAENEREQEAQPAGAVPQVQPDGVGQATISARLRRNGSRRVRHLAGR